MNQSEQLKIVLCDLDGVVWLAHEPLLGAVEAVSRLRRSGIRVIFVTNNSFSTMEQQLAALSKIGIDAKGDVVTSAMSAAYAMNSGERALVCGGAGIVEALTRRGVEVSVAHEIVNGDQSKSAPSPEIKFDAVVVGLYREFSYEVLSLAQRVVHGGARLIGTNEDPVYPTTFGVTPGGGSILAAVATASGVTPHVTGKPHSTMASMVKEMAGPIAPSQMLMVGDRFGSDGEFARQLNCRFALVRSEATGVESANYNSDGLQMFGEFPSLASVADQILEKS